MEKPKRVMEAVRLRCKMALDQNFEPKKVRRHKEMQKAEQLPS
jgi:hypothetical protein